MPPTVTERYAVVSCHVERPLDARVWARVRRTAAAPAGRDSRRSAHPASGLRGGRARRDDLARARARRGRPRASRPPHALHEPDARPADRRRPGRAGRPGGSVAPRARALRRPSSAAAAGTRTQAWRRHVPRSDTWTSRRGRRARRTCRTGPPGRSSTGRRGSTSAPRPCSTAVPTTHGAGDLLRAVVRPGLPAQVHAYFHDTDLVDPRRRRLIALGLRLLARRRPASDLDAVAASLDAAPLVPWAEIGRGEPVPRRTAQSRARRRIRSCRLQRGACPESGRGG